MSYIKRLTIIYLWICSITFLIDYVSLLVYGVDLSNQIYVFVFIVSLFLAITE